MKRSVDVELVEEHAVANFYSPRFSDERDTLFDQFLDQFDIPSYDNDLYAITYWLDKIGAGGALERYFKNEGHPRVKAIPLPPPSSKLRLYCYRISDEILLIAGGGEKHSRTYQEDPDLWRHVKIAQRVGDKLRKSLGTGETIANGPQLGGKLTFQIEI